MRFTFSKKTAIAAAACACALVIAAGCSSGGQGSGNAPADTSSAAPQTSAAAQPAPAAGNTSPAVQPAPAAGNTSPDVQQPGGTGGTSAPAQAAVPEGAQVFEGTVVVGTAEDIIGLQGIDIDPAAAGGGGTYAVLVFDEETEVTGMSADGTGERTEKATMLGIAEYTAYESFVVEYGDLELCEGLNGQHVTLAASADKIMFPSDVRIPIGQPSASEVVLL